MEYVVRIEPDTTGFMVTCPEIPEMGCGGETREAALREAVDSLVTALSIYIDDRRVVPLPRKARAGETTVRLPAQAALTVLLHNEMISQGIRKAELGRRLNIGSQAIERLLDVCHPSKLEGLEAAIEAVGKHVIVAVA